MAQEVTRDTNVEEMIKKQVQKEQVFGYVSNKLGKVTLVNKATYEVMLDNNDTMLDGNGLNDVFANLSEKELETITKYHKANTEKREELKKEAHKVMVKKIVQLRNWMKRFLNDEIADEKTDLEPEVIEALRKMTVASDSSASAEIIAEKDAEIEELKRKLSAVQPKEKASKTPVVETVPEVPEIPVAPVIEDAKAPEVPVADASDDPFKQ